jgi:hypothetical protein
VHYRVDCQGSVYIPIADAMKMKYTFPVLTPVWLRHGSRDINAPPLPDSFLGRSAPRLRSPFLDGISFPALPKLLLFTDDIVTLGLLDIPLSGYISS